MKKIGLVILGIILIGILAFSARPHQALLHLPNKDIHLIVVDTPATRELGLSGREGLPENTGMFFVFDKPDRYAFWMKDMKFPIDIIWLDEKYRIVHIESNLSPSTFPTAFTPPEKSLYVLEANAFFAEKNNLMLGSILDIDLKK